ncbi:unnamed protein product [Rhodiola kirilowii]
MIDLRDEGLREFMKIILFIICIKKATDNPAQHTGKGKPHPQTYLGCMKKGLVFNDPKLKWLA